MQDATETLRARLEADRRDLLDLSLRNPLLNYRPRARGLECVEASPPELFRLLVREGNSLTFLPGVGPPASRDSDSAGSRAPLGMPAACPIALTLKTTLSPEELQRRLLALSYAARTALEEQGVNTLFLALGLLTWYEADSSPNPLRAPLLLVPVILERFSARERFRLRHDGEDVGPNLSLEEKLRTEFGLTLPPLPDPEEMDVVGYLDVVAEAVREQPRWAVERGAAVLGFFSFSKFLMYRDLDEESWPEGAGPCEHPILRALLSAGFSEPASPRDEDGPVDRDPAVANLRLVVDADGTQTRALLDAAAGRNLVIQGPPGTGKSQTITNLIADAVSRGQAVLFVAEKRAALEVVQRRLDAVGLGTTCLELHSHKTSKKAVLHQVRRSLEAGKPGPSTREQELSLWDELRQELDDYRAALHTPIGSSGVTPYQAIGELLSDRKELEGIDLPPLELPSLPTWTGVEFRRRLGLVERLQARIAALSGWPEHPFFGSRRTTLLPGDEDRLRDRIREARHATAAVREAAASLARFLRLTVASTRAECVLLLRAALRAAEAAHWQGAQFRGEWLSRRDDLRELLGAGKALAELRRRHEDDLLSDAWERDLVAARQALNAHGRSRWRLLASQYRRAHFLLASVCRTAPPANLDAQLMLLDAIQESHGLREVVRRHDALAARLFGRRWRGEASDWEALAEIADGMDRLHRDVRADHFPRGLLDFLADAPALAGLETLTRAVETTLAGHHGAIGRLLEFLECDKAAGSGAAGGGLAERSFEVQEGLLDHWSGHLKTLDGLIALNRLAERCRGEGLAQIVTLAEAWPGADRHLVALVRRHWYEGLLRRAYQERPTLAEFDGLAHDQVLRAFRAVDRRLLVHERVRTAFMHWQRLPRYGGGAELALLRRELVKKARHLPVRQLLARAGGTIQAITPVFLMSPLSVATYLPPGAPPFDLVIFDEASQVRPVDALGALLRGRQAVVVGDSRQLPPTRFFDRLTAGDDAEDEETSSDVESLLDLFLAQGAPERMLRWHYRSQHESLIAVSNREFYENRLIIFPSRDSDRRCQGLILHHLPHTAYDRGKTRTNVGEAEAVARVVMEHARAQLGRSINTRRTLGVVALSTAQSQAVQDQLEALRREDPACEAYFSQEGPEPFCVKNLENVQGDERDVIFVSVGYGRTADGVLTLNFGPLNAEGGERRLNVLFTRARSRCAVFTNLSAEDLDVARTRSRGVRALRTFLAYAAAGQVETSPEEETASASPFVAAVRSALSAAGFQVRAHVGPEGSALDLAVVDPDHPGRYLLGVECDAPNDLTAASARDRDRLRPEVLEGLGWRLHQVRAPDWYRDPEGELARLLSALALARGHDPRDHPPRGSPQG